ncbi:unnamed protein product [Durusdinium trenchii]|uniref:Pentatricopeptide repeat-containing protein n=1 Tax=Durusdinium trenchii TaxID=1381693 RepID=A0ABP0SXF9_9DINO
MQEMSFEPNALTYAALLAVSSPKTGLELLKQMPVVSLQIYSAAVGLCQRMNDWRTGHQLIHDMRSKRCDPDVVTYSFLISCHETANRWREVPDLLAQLQEFIL